MDSTTRFHFDFIIHLLYFILEDFKEEFDLSLDLSSFDLIEIFQLFKTVLIHCQTDSIDRLKLILQKLKIFLHSNQLAYSQFRSLVLIYFINLDYVNLLLLFLGFLRYLIVFHIYFLYHSEAVLLMNLVIFYFYQFRIFSYSFFNLYLFQQYYY